MQGMKGGEHPEKSSLLAFLRGQRLEDQECIRLHLTRCSQCQETCADLSQSSKPLDILNQMSRFQRYPELSPVVILMQAQRNAQKQSIRSQLVNRPRPKKSAVRLVSLPVAFAVGLLCMTVIIVLAYTLAHFVPLPSLPGTLHWGITPNQSNPGGLVQPQPSPMPSPTQTATVTGSPTPTGMSGIHGPNIVVCSTADDIKNYRLVICGSNFEPKDKVELFETLIPNKPAVVRGSITVKTKGEFRIVLYIFRCSDVPLAIVAEDVSSKPLVFSNKLTNITMSSCLGPNPYRG